MERGHRLGTGRTEWRYPSADWVERCRRDVQLKGKLRTILSGRDQPADHAERTDLATLAARKKHYAVAVRLFAEAFAERPALADDLDSSCRYNAACYALRAACGQGEDESPPSQTESTRFRAQALGWLRADLAARAHRLQGRPDPARVKLLRSLQDWRNDPDLAGVRDPGELAKLPEAERREWQALWDKFDACSSQANPQNPRRPGPLTAELPDNVFTP